MPLLSIELLDHVINSLIPSATPVAFPPSHEITKTLLSLCLATRATHFTALRLLFRHCVYIDSRTRLEHILRTLRHYEDDATSISCARVGPWDQQNGMSVSTSILSPLMTSVYLQPFDADTIDDLQVAEMVNEFFGLLSGTLKSLVIDMKLRSVYPEDDLAGVRPVLRAAFQQLRRLEEFTSVRDELYLDAHSFDDGIAEPHVWGSWKQLQRLALYNVDLQQSRFNEAVAQLEGLSQFGLVRADGIDEGLRSLADGREHCMFLIINTENGHRWWRAHQDRVEEEQEEQLDAGSSAEIAYPSPTISNQPMRNVWEITVPWVPDAEDDEKYHFDIDLCQAWLKEHAVGRSLWNCTK